MTPHEGSATSLTQPRAWARRPGPGPAAGGTIAPVPSDAVVVRRALPADAPALVEIRAVMLAGAGTDPGGPDAPWRAAAEAWFRDRLAGDDVAAVVAEHPADGVVSGAVGCREDRPPGPGGEEGVHGTVYSVATLPEHRGRGLARACVSGVLDWFRSDPAVATVSLAATAEGEQLYLGLGFASQPFEPMRLHLR